MLKGAILGHIVLRIRANCRDTPYNNKQETPMPDLFENPMGLDGFEFVEFASPEPGVLEPVFHALGFEAVARHRSKKVTLYRQGGINFILVITSYSIHYTKLYETR